MILMNVGDLFFLKVRGPSANAADHPEDGSHGFAHTALTVDSLSFLYHARISADSKFS